MQKSDRSKQSLLSAFLPKVGSSQHQSDVFDGCNEVGQRLYLYRNWDQEEGRIDRILDGMVQAGNADVDDNRQTTQDQKNKEGQMTRIYLTIRIEANARDEMRLDFAHGSILKKI